MKFFIYLFFFFVIKILLIQICFQIVFVSTSEKEAEIAKLEAAVENKDETIAQLRASLLQVSDSLSSKRNLIGSAELNKDGCAWKNNNSS